ncbi:uncharacterized protein [Parasteatoda tepidariorum]|uniref:uncharacterized protein n=1 Tax=Parasteatoda tepidariorum TaxID=114398 RepID=UPI00077F8D28|nr:uncharacterized protein LOC107448006 [Parasteatoda tepidariorum]
MKYLGLILVLSIWIYAAADEAGDEWKAALCSNDDELLEDIYNCFELEPKAISDPIKECFSRMSPSANDDLKEFTKSVCKDEALYEQMDSCYEGYGVSAEQETYPEMTACYKALFEKHGLVKNAARWESKKQN